MQDHADKKHADKAQAVSQKFSGASKTGSAGFADNRIGLRRQYRLQESLQQSPRSRQLSQLQAIATGISVTPRPDVTQALHHRESVVQRMTLLPFADADKDLTDFADKNAQGMAGDVVKGNPGKKIGQNEKLVLIGHGNGFNFYSHGQAGHKKMTLWDSMSLADFLEQYVLPDGYAGQIMVWSCNSATPWKNIPAIKAQLPKEDDDDQGLLNQSFIKQLEIALSGKEGKNYRPNIIGAIGFASLHKKWDEAEVYADETLKNLGAKKEAKEGKGFIGTQDEAPAKGWYDYVDGSDEEEYSSSDDEQSDSAQNMQVVQPVQLLPLSQLYPGYAEAIQQRRAGAKILRECGHILIPADTDVKQMPYLALMKKNGYIA